MATIDISRNLPLLVATPRSWAEIAAADLPVFLADHAVCEQQAALAAMNLLAHYAEDDELVMRMSSLAAEEIAHLRRVAKLLHDRGHKLARRRPNPFVNALREGIRTRSELALKVDRLLVCALIEARSCERFSRLLEVVEGRDGEVASLLEDLGPAEQRHWELFHRLACREIARDQLDARWQWWLERERDVISGLGTDPTVHG